MTTILAIIGGLVVIAAIGYALLCLVLALCLPKPEEIMSVRDYVNTFGPYAKTHPRVRPDDFGLLDAEGFKAGLESARKASVRFADTEADGIARASDAK